MTSAQFGLQTNTVNNCRPQRVWRLKETGNLNFKMEIMVLLEATFNFKREKLKNSLFCKWFVLQIIC